MTPTVEVDEPTFKALEFAARISGTTPGGIVARLVEAASTPAERPKVLTGIDIFADYEGHRTRGMFDPATSRIDITSGPLSGQSFKTPSAAACAVVAHYKPEVSPNRNGWDFWLVADTGDTLNTIRRSG